MSSGRSRGPGFGLGLLVGAAIAVALLALVGPLQELLPERGTLSRAAEAQQVIEDSYFRPTDSEELENASIDGMVKRISKANDDRFSHYFDPAEYERFQVASSGRFSGIGVTVTEAKRGLRVAQVFKGAPAEDADIEPGDLIVGVDGKSLAGVSADAAAAQIKGPPGTTVDLTVADAKSGERRQVEVERANVRVPVVTGRIERSGGQKIAYVRLAGFTRGAHGELRKEIEKLGRRGAEGLVFDLRGNGGGLVDEAVLVQSIFQEEGPVLTIDGRARDERTFEVTGDPLEGIGPIAVLVDENTASASEIVTAALQENDLATVVGTRTYGKGVFQEVIPLDAGGALDLTVGEYLTADGTSILGKGVVPDRRVKDEDPSDGDAVLDAGLDAVTSRLQGK
ncbi:MAG TPA: S41 family peptidase [Solirubrobacterales bacterium]|nr:S41 family peptidase [Solirubrobacterales bacterium]